MPKKIHKIELVCMTCRSVFSVWQNEIDKGRKFCSKKCVRWTVTARKNHVDAIVGDKNPNWAGDGVGYKALHEWVRNHIGKTDTCERCGQVANLDLANISQEYKRDISDWEWLCRKCHMEKDGRLENLIKNGRLAKHVMYSEDKNMIALFRQIASRRERDKHGRFVPVTTAEERTKPIVSL